jgi:hypothetical protein
MVNINFGTETVVYNIIEVEGGETLSVDATFEQLLRLTDKVDEKKIFSTKEIETYPIPSRKWLVEMGAFIINEDRTLSKGDNYKEIKSALKTKKQTSFWDDENEE